MNSSYDVKAPTYPGYPETRLVITETDRLSNLTLPDGEWSTGVFTYPTLEQQEQLRSEGYELDDFGRPLHPWLREMISDPKVGVVTGLGEYWHWGPNRTADPIVINTDTEPKVLLIKRSDTGAWALPGGFIDTSESGVEAARRELCEEAGLVITGEPLKIYDGVVADARTTAHAWPETIAVLWRVDSMPEAMSNDDAVDAKWFSIHDLPSHLYGSHAHLIEQAVHRLDDAQPASLLELPQAAISFNEAKGGHMSYRRLIATVSDGTKYFVKSHDKQAFTYPVPEAHSLQYLAKEKLVYDHILRHDQTITPTSVDIINGNSLIMNALSPEDGWQWRATNEQLDTYIEDAIKALQRLQDLPLPDNFHDTILPTYQTHIHEGWKIINDDKITKIRDAIDMRIPRMREDFRPKATLLSERLDELRTEFDALSEPDTFYLTHHDFRQANLAWHPEQGVKIVDWSWAGAGRVNSDITTLLIDLNKSGHDVNKHMVHFNDDHALTLIGFWLEHSLWPTRTEDDTVRFHQILSAVSAYDLLLKER